MPRSSQATPLARLHTGTRYSLYLRSPAYLGDRRVGPVATREPAKALRRTMACSTP